MKARDKKTPPAAKPEQPRTTVLSVVHAAAQALASISCDPHEMLDNVNCAIELLTMEAAAQRESATKHAAAMLMVDRARRFDKTPDELRGSIAQALGIDLTVTPLSDADLLLKVAQSKRPRRQE